MSQALNKKKLKENIWKNKILTFLQENPSGFTIKDIAEGIESTRITVSKYLTILEHENKVISQEIGVYKLYFSAERKFIAVNVFLSFYNSILTGIKNKFNKEELKEIGHIIADNSHDFFMSQFPESLKKEITSYKKFLNSFTKFYPYLDLFYTKGLEVEAKVSEEEEKAVYYLSNVDLLKNPDYENHFYIMTGVLEKELSRVFPRRPTICKVLSVNKSEKSVEISLERQH